MFQCRPKRLAFVFVAFLSVFGLLLNVANDHSILSSNRISLIDLNPTVYSSKYCVIYDFWKLDGYFKNDSITLVLHSTLKYLPYLEEHIKTWTGPISISIFTPSPSLKISKSILSPHRYLNTLFSMLNRLEKVGTNKVSIHLFYEKSPKSGCKQSQFEFKKVFWTSESIKKIPNFFDVYPINVARNIARKRLKTRLFLSSDIEQLFSRDYEQKVGAMAYSRIIVKKQKMALIHRRFEVAENIRDSPQTKDQLKKLYDQEKAVEFHKNFYPNGHFIPNLKEWFEVKEKGKIASIFGILKYTNPEYEPQFVGDSNNVPFHDENFPFRLRSNTHLAMELCRDNFTFAILNDVFSIHKGIKTNETGVELAAKKLAFNNGYLKTVKQFILRLDKNYPHTKDQCPKFLP